MPTPAVRRSSASSQRRWWRGTERWRWRGTVLAIAALVAATTPSCRSSQPADSAATISDASVGSSDTEAARMLPQALDNYQADLYRESEARLSQCMAEAGFDYNPGDPLEDGYQQVDPALLELDSETFVNEYAWGYSTILYLPRPYDPASDPNVAAREGLGASDQAVWDETLGHCTQVLEQTAAADTYEFVQLRSAQQIGLGIYNEDPRVAAEYERWSSCIADAGVDGFVRPLDVEDEIRDSMNQLINQAGGTGTVTVEALTAMPEYDAIVQRERDIASASLDCEFPPPLLQRNETLNVVLLESLRTGLDQFNASQLDENE